MILADFRENIGSSEGFREPMCDTGTKARGSLRKCAFLQKV
jgi:hypothetical protein